MATGPTLPPQAYTREILTAAFNWLQTQPESVKKLATNPDALVGLYLRAQRYGNSNLETDAPVSSQAFMNDLKNLAEGLRQFEETDPLAGGAQPNGHAGTPNGAPRGFPPRVSQNQAAPSTYAGAQTLQSPAAQGPGPSAPTFNQGQSYYPPPASPFPYQQTQAAPAPAPPVLVSPLNERSLQMIQEVKAQLNLSSDAETLNMMLALAYKNLKNLLA